jgi:O-antigen/teichoic acid export membrane protein
MINRVLVKNITYLYIFQAAEYLVPLLTTPYLARVLGVEEFGRMGVAYAVVGYFLIVGEWGYPYTAVAAVARNADNPSALRRILWDVLIGKAFLATLSLCVLIPTILIVPSLRAIWPIVAATALLLVNNVVALHWFLQGLEKLGPSSIAGLVARLLTLPLIFAFVKSPADTWIAAAILTGTLFLSSAVSIVVAMRSVQVLPISASLRGTVEQARAGWRLALSNGAVTFFSYTSIVVVAAVGGPIQAGYLNGAERIKRAVQNITLPLAIALYPRINNMMVSEPHKVPHALSWLIVLQGGVTLALSLAMFVSAPWVTLTLLGKDFAPAIPVVQVLSLTPFLTGLKTVLGTNAMLPFGMKSAFSTIVILSSLVNGILILPLVFWSGAIGAAIAYVTTEIISVLMMAGCLFSRRSTLAQTLESQRTPGPEVQQI